MPRAGVFLPIVPSTHSLALKPRQRMGRGLASGRCRRCGGLWGEGLAGGILHDRLGGHVGSLWLVLIRSCIC